MHLMLEKKQGTCLCLLQQPWLDLALQACIQLVLRIMCLQNLLPVPEECGHLHTVLLQTLHPIALAHAKHFVLSCQSCSWPAIDVACWHLRCAVACAGHVDSDS